MYNVTPATINEQLIHDTANVRHRHYEGTCINKYTYASLLCHLDRVYRYMRVPEILHTEMLIFLTHLYDKVSPIFVLYLCVTVSTRIGTVKQINPSSSSRLINCTTGTELL